MNKNNSSISSKTNERQGERKNAMFSRHFQIMFTKLLITIVKPWSQVRTDKQQGTDKENLVCIHDGIFF